MDKRLVLKVLLACGVISSVLYVGSDIVGALLYPGYNYAGQAFSELLAIGSPVRSFMIATANVYNALVMAFAIGVVLAAGAKRSLRVTGFLLMLFAVTSAAGPYIPMHVRGTSTVAGDLPHILITAAGVLAILLFVGVGAFTRRRGFMVFSIATLAAVIGGGALAAQQVQVVAAGLPSPFLGLIERVNIYGTMLWVAALSVLMLRDAIGRRVEVRSSSTARSGDGVLSA